MFAQLSDAVRAAHGKWVATLADPVADMGPCCASTTQGVGIEPESLENSLELFQFFFERFVRDAEDGVDAHLHAVEFQQCCLIGCLHCGWAVQFIVGLHFKCEVGTFGSVRFWIGTVLL